MEAIDTGPVGARLRRLASTARDHLSAQRSALAILRGSIPFDVGVASTVDPATLLWTSCEVTGMEPDPRREAFMFENEYRHDDLHPVAELARRPMRAARLSAVPEAAREASPRSRMMREVGVGDELRCALVDAGSCWGSLELYRGADAAPFTDAELRAAASLSSTLAGVVRVALLRLAASRPEAVEDPPGVAVLGDGGQLEASSPAARRWLAELSEDGAPPPSVLALHVRLAAGGAEATTITLPRRSGGWLRLHASRLEGDPGRRTSIVLEPVKPAALASTVIRAYGFTTRESEVIALLAAGSSAKQIARRLGISAYTVNDHLKAVYEKAGVQTRSQLIAALFFGHCLPERQRNAPPGPYGWFLDGQAASATGEEDGWHDGGQ